MPKETISTVPWLITCTRTQRNFGELLNQNASTTVVFHLITPDGVATDDKGKKRQRFWTITFNPSATPVRRCCKCSWCFWYLPYTRNAPNYTRSCQKASYGPTTKQGFKTGSIASQNSEGVCWGVGTHTCCHLQSKLQQWWPSISLAYDPYYPYF